VYQRNGQAIYSCRKHYAPMPMDFQLGNGRLVSIRWRADSICSHLPKPFNGRQRPEENRIIALIPSIDACILLYSCTDRPGFQALVEAWEQRRLAHDRSAAQGALCEHLWVVANKEDCPSSEKVVSAAEGEQWANDIGGVFRGISALNGRGTKALVEEVVSAVLCEAKGDRTNDIPRSSTTHAFHSCNGWCRA